MDLSEECEDAYVDGTSEKEASDIHGAQLSEIPCFNMVAERANGSNGRSQSEREGSEQQDLPGEQQQDNSEQELQRQRFLRIRRVDSRDI